MRPLPNKNDSLNEASMLPTVDFATIKCARILKTRRLITSHEKERNLGLFY